MASNRAVPHPEPGNHRTPTHLPGHVAPPQPSPASIPRPALLDLLTGSDGPAIAALIAPPGYGKTTLLGQWAIADRRPVAWLTLDALDNDPALLAAHVAASLRRTGTINLEDLVGHPVAPERIMSTVVPRLAWALHEQGGPGVIILDDIHVLTHPPALDVVATLIDHLPVGWRAGLAGRHEPQLPFARFRAERRLLEVGVRLLALDAEETAALATAAGCQISTEQAVALCQVTEGWAAGIYLALLAADAHEPFDPVATAVRSAPIADYLESQVGAGLDAEDARFLRHTSVLEVVTDGAAEAVAMMPDARARLARLARANLLIQPSGEHDRAFRYHHVLREHLRADLERSEPAVVTGLHRRAALHCSAAGAVEEAVEHAFAAEDMDMAACFVTASAIQMLNRGRGATLDRWFGRFASEDLLRHGPLAVTGAWFHLLSGDGAKAELLAAMAERATYEGRPPNRSASFESQRALLRSVMVRNGPRDALENATLAADCEPVGSLWYPNAQLHLGCALLMTGDEPAAIAALEAAARNTVPSPSAAFALAILASVEIQRGDWGRADELAQASAAQLGQVNYDGLVPALGVFAVSARIAAHLGDAERCRSEIVRAQLVLPLANDGMPWHSVFGLTQLARAHLATMDTAGARVALREAARIAYRRPRLGTLVEELSALRRTLDEMSATLAGATALSAAELRVLPMLATHLTVAEIGDRLTVSPHTVKSHVMSIYRKLLVTSRSEAVERAVEIGLLEAFPALPRRRA